MSAFHRFQRLPVAMQLAGAAATVLTAGTLTPWITYRGDEAFLDFTAGVDLSAGEVCIFIGAVVIFLVSRMAKHGRVRDGGAIAGLGLLACGVLAITGIRVHEGENSVGWGMWISAGGAGVLLVAGLLLFQWGEPLPPPD